MRRLPQFEAAQRARQELREYYRLSPHEAYVLRSAPISGLSHALSRRRHGESASGRILTIWLVRDENLSLVVEGLLRRGLLVRRDGVGPACAELTAEGRAAMEAGQTKPLR